MSDEGYYRGKLDEIAPLLAGKDREISALKAQLVLQAETADATIVDLQAEIDALREQLEGSGE